MTKKVSAGLSYALTLSIVVLMIGFLGFGIRVFASAMISSSIYVGAFGVLLFVIPLYFVRRRVLAGSTTERRIRRPSAAWQVQVRPQGRTRAERLSNAFCTRAGMSRGDFQAGAKKSTTGGSL